MSPEALRGCTPKEKGNIREIESETDKGAVMSETIESSWSVFLALRYKQE